MSGFATNQESARRCERETLSNSRLVGRIWYIFVVDHFDYGFKVGTRLKPVEYVPMKRVFFWVFCVLGALVFAFGLLLTQVPRPRHDKDFRVQLIVWASCSCLLLVALLFSRKSREGEESPSATHRPIRIPCIRPIAFRHLCSGQLHGLFEVALTRLDRCPRMRR
jgi:hypothetical protein